MRICASDIYPTPAVVAQLIKSTVLPIITYSMPFIKWSKTNLHKLDSMICRCIRHSCRLLYNTCLYTMLTLCGIPSAVDLQQGTIVAMCKSIQDNNNPFNKRTKLMLDNMLQYTNNIAQQSSDNVNNNNRNVNQNDVNANNTVNAEQQQLQQSDRDIRAGRRNRRVVLADTIHHAHTALSIDDTIQSVSGK